MSMLNGWRLTRTGILFIVGIIVLAGLVFGGIMIVRNRGEQARRAEAVKIAEQNLEDQSKVVATQPNTQITPASEDQSATKQTQTTTETAALPTTGADLNQIIIVTVLSLSIAFYVTSRRAVRQL